MGCKTTTSDDILGKDAVDPEGQILGVVMKLHIDKDSKKIAGITVDQGFMKPDLFIGASYIRSFGIDAVLLNRVPATKFRGLSVMTHSGKVIGFVKDVKTKRHKVDEIIISGKGKSFSRKRFSLSARDIVEIGEFVLLKEGYELKKLEK